MREIFVEKSFASKTVLVTGATGFVGKVLVEKLLRSCSGITKVYIILRSKKGQGLEKRFSSFKESIVFDGLRTLNPSALDKLIAVEGDLMTSPMAGIPDEDLKRMRENVNFVFHCAASVRFDDPLENALKINTISTRNLLDFAEQCSNLDAFVHVSTAYSNINRKVIYEKVYEPVFDYNEAIELVELKRTEELEQLNVWSKEKFPNTYIFSKNLAEQLVADRSKRLPITIVRPSIICPSIREPYPGWVDSMNGPMAVLVGASSGLLRTVHGSGDSVPDLIPCDFVVNTIIVAAASVSSNENKELRVYNCTSSKQQPISWNEFLDLSREVYKSCPSTKVVWYPGGRMAKNYAFYLIYFAMFQLLPAFFIDSFMMIAGRKTWAVKLQKRIFRSLKIFDYFVNASWEWDVKNFSQLQKLVTLNER